MALHTHDMPIEVAQGDLVTRYVELGDMAIRHATLPAGTDMAPVLHGLPDDRCPSPHWGIVLTGSIPSHTRTARPRPRRQDRSTTGRPDTPASQTAA